MKLEIDQYFWLQGDEDGDVNLQCRQCDRGGMPIVYLTTNQTYNPYLGQDVIVVYKISDMFAPATKHIAWHRAKNARGTS